MITYRRMSPLGRQAFLQGYIAFEKADDGSYYYATEAVSRLFLREIREKYGVGAVRKLFESLRKQLEAEVRERKNKVVSEAQAVDIQARPRRHEEWLEMIGQVFACPDCGAKVWLRDGPLPDDAVLLDMECMEKWVRSVIGPTVEIIQPGAAFGPLRPLPLRDGKTVWFTKDYAKQEAA